MPSRTLHFRALIMIFAFALVGGPAATAFAQDNQETYDDISEEMADIRGLDLLEPIDVEVKTRQELQDETRDDLEVDYPQAERDDDQLVLEAFGLIDPDQELGELYVDLLGEQIAGYYDPATNEMVVVASSDANELSAADQITFAHEVVHALQDQHYDLESYNDIRLDGTSDQSLAVTALIEGDATLAQIDFILGDIGLAREFLAEIEGEDISTEQLDSAPPIISQTLLFPYDQGQVFTQFLYDEGGWDLIDEAYDNPPATTEQILHPEKYLDGEEGIDIETPDLAGILGADWRTIDEDTFGEFQILILLADGGDLSEEQVATASEGWGGDAYAVATSESGEAILWQSEWDSPDDAEEFAKALANRESARLGADAEAEGNTYSVESETALVHIEVDGTAVTYVYASDQGTLEQVLAGTG
ncbi:MAG: hypothetical protein M3457_14790 [Chloroflexota bacterium]|nr:hypothetical protein [Chloroflexota bacterium]